LTAQKDPISVLVLLTGFNFNIIIIYRQKANSVFLMSSRNWWLSSFLVAHHGRDLTKIAKRAGPCVSIMYEYTFLLENLISEKS
jgi:hypothetical protein